MLICALNKHRERGLSERFLAVLVLSRWNCEQEVRCSQCDEYKNYACRGKGHSGCSGRPRVKPEKGEELITENHASSPFLHTKTRSPFIQLGYRDNSGRVR